MSLQLDVLGPVRVRRDATELPPEPTQRRAVLAVLVCHANRCVPVTRLVEAVWGDDPPRTATKNLQVHIYHLRHLLGDANRIASAGDAYALRAAPEEIDAVRFERAVMAAREALDSDDPELAARHATEALELWRGPAFCDLDQLAYVAHRRAASWSCGWWPRSFGRRLGCASASTRAPNRPRRTSHCFNCLLWTNCRVGTTC